MKLKLFKKDFYCWGNGDKYDDELIIEHNPKITGREIADEILQNQELRIIIVDLADLWDGSESDRYGNRLHSVLKELGINDVPEFYKNNNISKMIKEFDNDKRK